MPVRPLQHTIAALTLAAAAVLSSCGNNPDDDAAAAEPTPHSASPRTSPAFEGAWHAGPAPYAAVVAALEHAGLARWADAVLQGNHPTSQVTYDLKLKGGSVVLASAVDDNPASVQDHEAYTASGQTITFEPIGSGCGTTFTWAVTGDQLTFELAQDTCPAYQGTPDEAYMRALYTAVPFQRVVG
jgi:hypothetical protein